MKPIVYKSCFGNWYVTYMRRGILTHVPFTRWRDAMSFATAYAAKLAQEAPC